MTTSDTPFLAPPYTQVASVVQDLDQAVRAWTHDLGIGPWTGYRLAPPRLRDTVVRGEPTEFSLRHAFAWKGDLQFELIQPLAGESIFAEHLETHGEGLHHLGKFVTDHAAAVQEALAAGFVPLQSARGYGAEGDGAFAYFQHPSATLIIELIDAPRVRVEPEFVYPSGG